MGHYAHLKKIVAGIGIVGALTAMSISPALAIDNEGTSTASASITGGDRTVTIGDVPFGTTPYQFGGHTITAADIALSVTDDTGTDAGYQIAFSATDLTSTGPDTIPATGFKVTAVDGIVSSGTAPVAGSNLATGNLSGAGQVVLVAAAGSGAGTTTADVDFSLDIPDNTLADSYSTTLTTTISAAP
jgi:hypothetical protein